MNKLIKTTNTNTSITASNIHVVEIGDLSFERDERFLWVDVYLIGGEEKEFLMQIDNTPVLSSISDLDNFAKEWFEKNVRIVEELTAQEQSNKYEEVVKEICANRLLGFKSTSEDAELINKIIETLAGEKNLSISHAQAILLDVSMILPMIIKI